MGRRKKQLEFKGLNAPKDTFGGESLKGNPKASAQSPHGFQSISHLKQKKRP